MEAKYCSECGCLLHNIFTGIVVITSIPYGAMSFPLASQRTVCRDCAAKLTVRKPDGSADWYMGPVAKAPQPLTIGAE